jgi:hypothetical protein
MSEVPSHGEGIDDSFKSLMDQFKDDALFMKDIEDIDDQMDENDVQSLFDQPSGAVDPKGMYYTVPVDKELQEIVDGFYEFCRHTGVDPYCGEFSDETLGKISEHVVFEFFAIKRSLAPGDTISSTEAMFVVPDEDRIEYVGEGRRLQGDVVEAIAWGIPDDVTAATLNASQRVPLGVGLVIESPVVIAPDGSRETLLGHPDVVVIALGTLALKVDKHFYQLEELFITPPDDSPTD